jgi:hypothetical protein
MQAPILPKFQRQISENRIGGSNDYLFIFLVSCAFPAANARFPRQFGAFAGEPNQENGEEEDLTV